MVDSTARFNDGTLRVATLVSRRANAEAQAWKEQPGSFGARTRLHGHELRLRPGWGHAGDDVAPTVSPRTRRYILRHRRSLRPLHPRRTRRRGSCTVPRSSGDRDEVRV